MEKSELYEQYAFCHKPPVRKPQDSPYHIRRLWFGEREKLKYFSVNGLASQSLCKGIPRGHAMDIFIEVNLDFNNVCEECAWIYWNDLLRKQSNG